MKDTNVGWIGKIPKHWDSVRGKYIFVNTKTIVGAKVDDYERLALTLNGVIKRSKDDNEGLQPTEFSGYQILKENELVFKLIDLQNISTSRVGLSKYTGIVSPAYVVLKTNKKVYPLFAEKYYLMMWMYEVFNALGDAGVRSNLNAKELLELRFPLPPYEEQKEIADYLDSKCFEIDELEKDIEHQIEILEEYKKSAITEAVTKGLNPNVEMKESGIEFVGPIPKKWLIKPFYSLLDKCKKPIADGPFGSNMKNEEYVDEGVPVIQIGSVKEKGIDFSKIHYVTEEKANQLISHNAQPFDIAITKMMPAGKACEIPDTFERYVVSADVIKATVSDLYLRNFLIHCFNTYITKIAAIEAQGSTRSRINIEKVKHFKFAIPNSVKEIEDIVNYLNEKCSNIDLIIEDKKRQLDTLSEYKKSLIYEYVTGKKEVA